MPFAQSAFASLNLQFEEEEDAFPAAFECDLAQLLDGAGSDYADDGFSVNGGVEAGNWKLPCFGFWIAR